MERVGFIGLGLMGEPIALNMARAGTPLLVWNRTASKCAPLRAAGASVAEHIDHVFSECGIVFLMLANAAAIDAVLQRNTAAFAERVRSRIIVHMGTTSPEFSANLGADIVAAGGSYVECPVSGSRTPAERGELVAMIAGDPAGVERVIPLLQPVARQTFRCGAVPNALLMKIAVNIFLITTVTGLAEAANFARAQHLDLETFRDIVDAGPMASSVSKIKISKMVEREFSAQAACLDVLTNNDLIVQSADAAGIPIPLITQCRQLFHKIVEMGRGGDDMAAVEVAFEQQSPAT